MDNFPATPGELFIEDAPLQEAAPSTLPTQARRINARSSDPTLRDLYERYCAGDLVLQPDFQRYFVWDELKSSRLIESVLLDLPLPLVYLAEAADGRESVVDGQQRLTAIFTFMDNKWPLAGLTFYHALNGLYFHQLDNLTRRNLRRAALRVTTILEDSDEEIKFEIFERLNTGSVALNDQEMRNCIYRGGYNNLLKKMAADTDFMALLGLSQPERRMRDVELVLRFAAFYQAGPDSYHAPLRHFLNQEMARRRDIDNRQAVTLFHAFRDAVQLVRDMLGPHAFRRFRRGNDGDPNGTWATDRFNAALYDILLNGFTRYPRKQMQPHLDTLREALLWLMCDDEEFSSSIEQSTGSEQMVRTRFAKWLGVLENVVGPGRPPSTARWHKHEILQRQPACVLCGNQIKLLDDVAIIGLNRYLPEETELSQDLRLAHRFCKWQHVRHLRRS